MRGSQSTFFSLFFPIGLLVGRYQECSHYSKIFIGIFKFGHSRCVYPSTMDTSEIRRSVHLGFLYSYFPMFCEILFYGADVLVCVANVSRDGFRKILHL